MEVRTTTRELRATTWVYVYRYDLSTVIYVQHAQILFICICFFF
jgi:hypothetical protein